MMAQKSDEVRSDILRHRLRHCREAQCCDYQFLVHISVLLYYSECKSRENADDAFDTKVYFRGGWRKNYTFVYVRIKLICL